MEGLRAGGGAPGFDAQAGATAASADRAIAAALNAEEHRYASRTMRLPRRHTAPDMRDGSSRSLDRACTFRMTLKQYITF